MSKCRACGAAIDPPKRVACGPACHQMDLRRRQGRWTTVDAAERKCLRCDVSFLPSRPTAKYCSSKCGWLHRSSQRPVTNGERRPRFLPCKKCGVTVETKGSHAYCDGCKDERNRAKNRRKSAVRRGAKVNVPVLYTIEEIGDRDGWRCHLCRKKVRRTLPGTVPKGPTIDHLIPVTAGGNDDPVNVALAHRECNVRRRHLGEVQLRLVG